MEKLSNFKLNPAFLLSKLSINLGLTDFNAVLNYIHQLPYGRNTERSDFTLVLKENKGTCSTKHAFLKQLGIENKQEHIKLYLGVYKMNNLNTSGIASVLKHYKLDYIPEAHTYLKVNNQIIDVTRTRSSKNTFQNSLLFEEQILPSNIGDYKLNMHQNFIKNWIKTEAINYTFNDLWAIRELCIARLSA